MKQRLFFTFLLVFEVAYLTLALAIPPLPGWKMFSHVEWVENVKFFDDQKNPISIQAFMPAVYYEFSSDMVKHIAKFICEKHPEVSNWSLEIEEENYVLERNNCLPRKK